MLVNLSARIKSYTLASPSASKWELVAHPVRVAVSLWLKPLQQDRKGIVDKRPSEIEDNAPKCRLRKIDQDENP
jgi:hypothetical protein